MPGALEDLVGNMTLTELAQRSGRTVAAIVDYALGSRSTSRRSSSGASKGSKPAASTTSGAARRRSTGGAVDTRTAGARRQFDETVLDAVRTLGTAQTGDIARITGGSEIQRRVALARLVKARKIVRTGKARSTSYSVR